MDAVDRLNWKLETKLLIQKQDLSLYMRRRLAIWPAGPL